MRHPRTFKISKSALAMTLPAIIGLAIVSLTGAKASGVGNCVPHSARMITAFIPPQEPFSPEERARLSEQAIGYLRKKGVANQRLRVLSMQKTFAEKGTASEGHSVASVVVFNYTLGRATRIILNASTGAVLSEELIRGRPQSSDEERDEAKRIIQADQEHARMLEAGGVLEGGFIVDDPRRVSRRDRFIRMQLLTRDRTRIQRLITVNLTNGRIAVSRKP